MSPSLRPAAVAALALGGVLAGCSSEPRADLAPVPTPVHVRSQSCGAEYGGCREPMAGLVLEVGSSPCGTLVHDTRLVGTALRITLKGMKGYGGLCWTVVQPVQEWISYGVLSDTPYPETVELVLRGQVDRYRLVSDSLAPITTSFSTPRPWGTR